MCVNECVCVCACARVCASIDCGQGEDREITGGAIDTSYTSTLPAVRLNPWPDNIRSPLVSGPSQPFLFHVLLL